MRLGIGKFFIIPQIRNYRGGLIESNSVLYKYSG